MSPIKSNRLKQRETAQRQQGRTRGRALVQARFERGGGVCEGCGMVIDVWERAHLFGKATSAKVDPLWAEEPELSAALCCAQTWGDQIGCHERIDRGLNAPLRWELRSRAVSRLAARLGCRIPPDLDPSEAIRQMTEGRTP